MAMDATDVTLMIEDFCSECMWDESEVFDI